MRSFGYIIAVTTMLIPAVSHAASTTTPNMGGLIDVRAEMNRVANQLEAMPVIMKTPEVMKTVQALRAGGNEPIRTSDLKNLIPPPVIKVEAPKPVTQPL
jgi:hypothetical protein